MKRVLFLTVFIPSIVFTQDIPSLIYKIALSTDMYQSEQWVSATKGNPLIIYRPVPIARNGDTFTVFTEKKYIIYEKNPLMAGQPIDHVLSYGSVIYHLPELLDYLIPDKFIQNTMKIFMVLIETRAIIRNMITIEKTGFDQRFLIHLTFPL